MLISNKGKYIAITSLLAITSLIVGLRTGSCLERVREIHPRRIDGDPREYLSTEARARVEIFRQESNGESFTPVVGNERYAILKELHSQYTNAQSNPK